MALIRTFIQSESDGDVIAAIHDVLIPAVKGQNIMVEDKWYEIKEVAFSCKCGERVSETIWVQCIK